jgi:hypothetical protein
MKNINDILIGQTPLDISEKIVSGIEVLIKNENFYKIENVDSMRPFFISIVSPYNHWFFISSNGSLSAGRKDSDNALFPYYTDDKITEAQEVTGSKAIFQIQKDGKCYLWEPFSIKNEGSYKTSRNLYKNFSGNKIIFEEINESLNIKFSYQWSISDRFGFIKESSIENTATSKVDIKLLDGIQNILPWGVEEALQNNTSNLVDAYKRNELDVTSGIGIYSLSAIIVDRAEPSEALKANIAWSSGLDSSKKLLSSKQLSEFRKGSELIEELDIKAEKGAYFLIADISLDPKEISTWYIGADVNKSSADIISFAEEIKSNQSLAKDIAMDIQNSSDDLLKLSGSSDGMQTTSDSRRNIRHFSNTLFNIMRGGIFDKNYQIEKADFTKYLEKGNKRVFLIKKSVLEKLPQEFNLDLLRDIADNDSDKDFQRLCYEYLPLKFSRRHGDPSRPWNKFSINTRSEIDESKILDYQGNWRDIFQNWEALVHSYPDFIDSMIFKFLNATTFDGYNPYRVTKDGFDWESLEQDNPWSYIGYWGDHQVIYLLKFLEFIEDYYPERINRYFEDELFVYANVPYRIKTFKDILEDPKNTIDFDADCEKYINNQRELLGSDGALLKDSDNNIIKVNFIEKLLATILAKVANLIPEAGIWMNTQRPEWNDANNALVGNGVSMVTLYYLRRFLHFFTNILKRYKSEKISVSIEQKDLLLSISEALRENLYLLDNKISDQNRLSIMNLLGNSAGLFRQSIYINKFSGKKADLTKNEILDFLDISLKFIEHSIKANKRSDGLYHAYNLMTVGNNLVSISHLPEMLEGQVAILSSGFLSSTESLNVLNSLKGSKLFREDQYSYILYPNKDLPGFLDKNNIHKDKIKSSKLLSELIIASNNQIVVKDSKGGHHFNGNFNNANSLKEELDNLPILFNDLVREERDLVLAIFEEIFDHKSFTGRSGTFYGYEGLGSIYWHMVSKLLLSTLEVTTNAFESNEGQSITSSLLDHYFEINEGIGLNKSPELYGAFPTDPYSHTPGGKGVQQPGMTGQVKEDVLSRFGELGLSVASGQISFNPSILKRSEFVENETPFKFINLDNEISSINLFSKSLGFTICQVPIIYKLSENRKVIIYFINGETVELDGCVLSRELSTSIFKRENKIRRIEVYVLKNEL